MADLIDTPPFDQPCPECGAEAGHPCLTAKGKEAKKPHAARGESAPTVRRRR